MASSPQIAPATMSVIPNPAVKRTGWRPSAYFHSLRLKKHPIRISECAAQKSTHQNAACSTIKGEGMVWVPFKTLYHGMCNGFFTASLTTMIKLHKFACFAVFVLMLVHALFTPFYEVGYNRVTSPIIFLAVAFLFCSMMVRKQWAWRWGFTGSIIYPAIKLAFLPTTEFFGSYTSFAIVLTMLEVSAFLAVFISMWSSTIKALYFPVVHDDQP